MSDDNANESLRAGSNLYDPEKKCGTFGGGSHQVFQIVVKRVGSGDGDTLTLNLDQGSSVLDLKNTIQKELAAINDQVPVDRQRLVFYGRMLRDNEELLGGKGIKMRTESINYVHLSPLPEGAKPSKRTSISAVLTEEDSASLEARLLRAHRLGNAARERRRLRRAQPYEPTRNRRRGDVHRLNVREHIQAEESHAQELASAVALAASSEQTNLHFSPPPVFTLPIRDRTAPVLETPSSPLSQISRLSVAMASSIREAQVTTLLANSHLMNQVRSSSTDLLSSMEHLEPRLLRIRAANISRDSVDETIRLLDRASRETNALAMALRTMFETAEYARRPLIAPPLLQQTTVSPLVLSANHVNSTEGAIEGHPMLSTTSWFTRMLQR